MLRNPRDAERRILCPTCGAPILDDDILVAGRLAYHRACWRSAEIFSEGA